MFTICFWLTIIVSLFISISYAEPIDFIVGGVNAEDGEFPYQVSLQYNKNHICGGSIIANCWIHTAAHCVLDNPVRFLSILAGTNKLNTNGVRAVIEKIIPHENYTDQIVNDIALIKLKQCLTYNKKIQAVKLLPSYIGDGVIGTVTGWGYTNQNGNQRTNDLKKLNARTITNQDCNKRVGRIRNGTICTLNVVGEGFCQGDSGGPLVEVSTKGQIGLVSANIPCARGWPDIYTRVSEYVNWITDKTK